jgi:hypothetical protein
MNSAALNAPWSFAVADAPNQQVVDLHTLFGPLPARGGDAGITRLRALLARHGVSGAVTLSTRALYYDAAEGNQETRDACGTPGDGGPHLLPGAVWDPRVPPSRMPAPGGGRLVCLFPATQDWPIDVAPLGAWLDQVSQSGAAPPLFWEVSRPGDATQIARRLGAAYTAPVILAGVSGATLAEALAAAADKPSLCIATQGLRGVGEVAAAASALGAQRVVFSSGAPRESLGAALALVRHAGLPGEAQSLILGGNARRLLGSAA